MSKENQKTTSDFDALDPTGCGSQRLLRYRSHPAGRCPNSSSLFPPLAAVVAVARKGLLAPFRPRRGSRSPKMLAASLNAFFGLLRFTAPPMVLRFRRTLRSALSLARAERKPLDQKKKPAPRRRAQPPHHFTSLPQINGGTKSALVV